MNKLILKVLLVVSFGSVTILGGNTVAADLVNNVKPSATSTITGTVPDITFLSREVSRSLKITPIPTSKPIPLIVGTYWNCHTNSQNFEICRIKVVVCEDDQSFCVDVNGKQDGISNITFLPREESKLLDITLIPTSDPIPLVVGTYWSCSINAQDFEICRIKIVVCSDNGLCTNIN